MVGNSLAALAGFTDTRSQSGNRIRRIGIILATSEDFLVGFRCAATGGAALRHISSLTPAITGELPLRRPQSSAIRDYRQTLHRGTIAREYRIINTCEPTDLMTDPAPPYFEFAPGVTDPGTC